jgi:uncharacterized membrane protein YfcA
MRGRDFFRYGGSGFIMGFYGTAASRARGVKAESDLTNATPLLTTTLIGAIDTLVDGRGEVRKFLPYILGLVIGGVAGAMMFDAVNPNYQAPNLRR